MTAANRVTMSRAEIALAAPGAHVFFVFAALFGALSLTEWVVAVRLGWADAVPPVMWHAHELVYGFAAAGLAGVASAWVPRWSGAPRISAFWLTLLAAVWLLGRLAMAVSGLLPGWLVAFIDLIFLPALAALVVIPHLAARPKRNLPLLALIAVLWLANLAMHAESFGGTFALAERGARTGIAAYLLMTAVICGRAVPDLAQRFLAAQGSPYKIHPMPLLDGLAIGTLLVYLASYSVTGMSAVTSASALAAAVFNGLRLCLWRGDRVLAAPGVLILHLGYLWMVVGLLLEAAIPVTNGVADMAAIHAFAGAIGTMFLAVIAHESMVHSRTHATRGQEMMVLAAYGLVSIAVVLRVAALFVPGGFVDLIIASGAVWSLGFFALLASYVVPSLVFLSARRPLNEKQKVV